MQNSQLQVPLPDSDLVKLNGMYVCMQIFMSGGEIALVSSMGNEIISVRLLIILLHCQCIGFLFASRHALVTIRYALIHIKTSLLVEF